MITMCVFLIYAKRLQRSRISALWFYKVCITSLVWILTAALPVAGQDNQALKCEGRFKGKKLTSGELKKVLEDHNAWLADLDKDRPDLNTPDKRRANLCGAYLSKGYFGKADLSYANLQEADLLPVKLPGAKLHSANLQRAKLGAGYPRYSTDLTDADLSGADLRWADLQGGYLPGAILNKADLRGAVLRGARLENSHLREADLRGCDLRGVSLWNADLTKADLSGADLSRADLNSAQLIDVELAGATLAGVNLTNARYEATAAPKRGALGGIKGLETIEFNYKEGKHTGLVLLRAAFKDAGLRQQERVATYLLERAKTQHAWWPESYFRLVFFEWPCDYGLAPGRLLRLLCGLIVVFTFVYVFPICRTGKSGIYRVWPEDSIHDDQQANEIERLAPSLFKAPGYAFYFSLLSAFHFGWRELNVGNWLVRMQSRDFMLRATGWVRVMAGLQSLISVYLVAMWALTYFGRPFE